ncbi:MAG: NAD(P)/FAD-dependent oxidoreductase [Desulfovibrio sp.]|jgi:geranylgeranyl reductase family protein|nr:NAD(P)/FAD-dependent oxidoreductase [Desulfovibrio sp.]
MTTLTCQIAVVGAGPAGSSAARAAAAAGARVLLLERRPEVGVPVRCAEYIPAPLVGQAAVDGDYIVQRTKGMYTFLNGKQVQYLDTPGCVIQRNCFDKALAAGAEAAGAQLLTKTSVTGYDGTALEARCGALRLSIRADVVIGADGPHSRVGRWMGSVNRHCLPAIQKRVALTRPMEHAEIFFDDDFPGGYGSLFPRGEEANVGVAMLPHRSAALRPALERLLSLLTARGRLRGTSGTFTGGWVPAEGPRSIVRGNMLLAGDAAGHANAITGAGVFQAVVGGGIAGKWAARAALDGDLSLLRRYEEEWNDFYGETLAHAFARRQLLEGYGGPLQDIFRRCWIGFREYYAPL